MGLGDWGMGGWGDVFQETDRQGGALYFRLPGPSHAGVIGHPSCNRARMVRPLVAARPRRLDGVGATLRGEGVGCGGAGVIMRVEV